MAGSIIAIGGAVRLDGPVLKEFFLRSGGQKSSIAILPTASSALESGNEYAETFASFGLKKPACILPVRDRVDTQIPEFLQVLREATGIFLTGGSQIRLTAILGGTLMHEELLAAHQRGIPIAGSSAGSAALSSMMITAGHSGSYARQRIAQFSPGLGLISQIIFDPHFRQRIRLGRLLYAVTSHPGFLGIGIDEDTAAVLEGNLIRVTGSSAVTIVDGAAITDSDIAEVGSGQLISISGIRLHVLTSGWVFDMHKRCAQKP